MEKLKPMDRKSGVAIWRQIADQLRLEIAHGNFESDIQLPTEAKLSALYQVNRHTIRAALEALAKEGLIESRQGQGTFVRKQKRIAYPIQKRTRFSEGLSSQVALTKGSLLAHRIEIASDSVADALKLTRGTSVICLETLSEADGIAISRATSWFCAQRFGAIIGAYQITGSITKALAACDVSDYVRLSTNIEAHHASADDADILGLSPGAIVLITKAINTDLEGQPIQYSQTRFAADRISLTIQSG